jgi:hypothetical protein
MRITLVEIMAVLSILAGLLVVCQLVLTIMGTP